MSDTDNLIEAWEDALEADNVTQIIDAGAAMRAALDAVQPVTPDRELVVKAIRDEFKAIRGGNSLSWSVDPEALADALLASGVLGQPQPQPDREAIREVLHAHDADVDQTGVYEGACSCGWREPGWHIPRGRHFPEWDAGDDLYTDHILDALLPLLGQPRTDEADGPLVSAWLNQVAPRTDAPARDHSALNHVAMMLREEYPRDQIKAFVDEARTDAPLDPEPWVVTGTTTRTAFPRMYGLMTHWQPQEGFEQDQARYPRTDEEDGR